MGALSVALVNDYPVVVRGLDAMLEPFADRVRVAGLGVREAPDEPVDVTLYDTFATSALLDDDPSGILGSPSSGRVLLYSWNLGPDAVEAALALGCAGYVDKTASAEELVAAIERAAAGQRAVVPGPTGPVEASVHGAWPGQGQGLSVREAEVLALITQGLTNEEIGRRLHLSKNTVKTYIRSAYLKAGVSRRSQAVRWGIEHGMLPGPAHSAS